MKSKIQPMNSFVEFSRKDAEGTILDRFEKQLHKYAGKIAVRTKTEELTYRALNQASNRLAHIIIEQLSQSEEPIPLLFKQGANLIIAFLGVLKAGRTFTALNPYWPDAGLAPIMKDLQAKLILTDTINVVQANALAENRCRIFNIDEIDESASDINPGLYVSPHASSHIIYTSGSTGRPNGVVHTHRNILHYIQEQTNSLYLCSADRIPLFFPLSHSAGMTATFRALLNGSTLFVFDLKKEGVMGMPEWIKKNKITFFHTFPSIFRQLPEILRENSFFKSIRLVHIGGEPVAGKDVAIYKKCFPSNSVLSNSIGCTETSTYRRYLINKETQLIDNTVPVGYAVEKKEVFLIDKTGHRVEPGCVGEIAVQSPYLASGYWRNPELTRKKFLPDPDGGNKRIFLTGDMGRMRRDGCLEYIGRKDLQSQIRGFRVETEAIDIALNNMDSVKQAVVIVRRDESGENNLVAYVVPTDQPAPAINDLRRPLSEKLPDYMLPSVFIFCDALPLLENGKVDREALPPPSRTRPELTDAFISPNNETQAKLVDIWAQVLNFDFIGIHDNFFDLGGHSLSAARIISLIYDAFHINLPLNRILKSPTVKDLAAEIDKHKIYHSQLEGTESGMPKISIDSENKYKPFPLTDIQQAYWVGRTGVLTLGKVSAHRYMEIESIDLDMDRLNQSWRQLIDRHDMLRAIMLPDGQQQILEYVPAYEIKVLDLRKKTPDERQTTLDDIRKRMSHQVIPGDRWPLFEITASRLDDRRFIIHMSFDAIIMDSWSRFIVFREWSCLYHQPKYVFEPIEISFRDYVLAEERIKDSVLYRDARQYWLNRLSTLPPAPDLPLSKNPEDVSLPKFAHWSSEIEPETWKRLKRRAAQVNLTSSGLLLALFAEVLKIWSKNPLLTLNLTHFDRRSYHPQINNIVGDFTLVTLLEVNNSEHSSFEARALCLQEQLWKDLGKKYFNGVSVVRELARGKKGLPKGLMPIVFTSTLTHDTEEGAQSPAGWLGKSVYNITQTPQVWIDHQIFEESGTLVFNWAVVEELFPDNLIDDMFAGYCNFLRCLSEDEALWSRKWVETSRKLFPVSQLEQRKAVNATEAPVSNEMLHTLFVSQVKLRPKQIGVVSFDRTLTYEELFHISNQIGCRLREMGACPNELVAVVMEKGWEQVAAVLGIHMSGAAYLPIDAGFPKERLWHLLAHGKVKHVLTQSFVDGSLEWPEGLKRICVDQSVSLSGVNDEPLKAIQKPEDLAYVIYTSGSTGLPKGVAIDHRGAVNTILDINRRFGVNSNDRVLALSSLSFDLSVYDIFGTLAAGGSIVVPEKGATLDPSIWAKLISQKNVTIWNSVPALMELLVDYLTTGSVSLQSSLRLIMLSGDWIPLTLPGQIKAQFEQAQTISLGGATEASIWSILYPIKAVDPKWKSIPYGRPMTNQQFHVLNDSFTPCPVWVPGQLFIGGIGLAKGYWRDEERTKKSFVNNPQTKERLYRTGDLGRFLPDGSIEFLGREDNQVKVQGFRVELGEIEAIVGKYPGIRSVAAKALEEKERKRLAVYVVPEPGTVLSEKRLRRFAQKKLPDYMVPSAFMMLEELPLTANGKIDRRALPDPVLSPAEPEQHFAAAVSNFTNSIARIVESVLDIDQIDFETNLLHLGATSVDMIRIANRLESELDFRPKMDELYRLPTVSGLAHAYEQQVFEKRVSEKAIAKSAGSTPESVLASYRIILDPAERNLFKDKQPGLRRIKDEKPSVKLNMPDIDDAMEKRYTERRSYRQFSLHPIRFAGFSELLRSLSQIQIDGKPKYLYGSAGGLYSVQTYLYIKSGRVENLDSGIYYYDSLDHRLVLLSPNIDFDQSAYDPIINRPIFDKAAFAVFFIAQLSAIAPMYGERSMHYATIEAGLMSQLLETSAPVCGIGLCQIGNLDFERIEHLFELDESHTLVHSLLGGLIDVHKSERWTPFQEAFCNGPGTLNEREEGEI